VPSIIPAPVFRFSVASGVVVVVEVVVVVVVVVVVHIKSVGSTLSKYLPFSSIGDWHSPLCSAFHCNLACERKNKCQLFMYISDVTHGTQSMFG